jgi:hypothetical protein
MGHRANYAICKDGEVELFYSHWGALTVPDDLFWGPRHAEWFIRSHRSGDPDSEWLDDAWGEGGAALNFDEKQVTLFGGEALGHPPLRATFLGLMRALWNREGWRVQWAEAGMPSIAAAVGCDPTLATSEPIPPFPVDLETIGDSFDTDDAVAGSLLSVVRDDQMSHRISDAGVVSTLFSGPSLLDAFERLPTVERALDVWEPPDYRAEIWTLGDELSHSGIIDIDSKIVAFRDDFAEHAAREFLLEKWIGWTVEKFEGPIDAHFERLGIEMPVDLVPRVREISDPSEVELTEEAALAEVAHYLISAERKDPAAFVRKIREDAGAGAVWVNSDAETSPNEVDLTSDQKQKLFGKAIALMKFVPR